MNVHVTVEEARVLGSLLEKHLATPQYYPLTLNALVNACNQTNNREPIVSYDDEVVLGALDGLREKGVGRLVHPGGGSRVTKYRHALDEALGLDQRELALLCVLLLRGPQTLNELRTRTDRLANFDGPEDVERDLDRLSSREPPLIEKVERRSGQKEQRYQTTLADAPDPGFGRAQLDMSSSSRPKRPVVPAEARIAPLRDDELSDDQRELVNSTGNPTLVLFRTLARNPGLFRRWLPFGGKLLQGTSFSTRTRELIILRTAYLAGAAYEWGHHVVIGKQAGLTGDEIAKVAAGPDGGGWEGEDRAVLAACDDLFTLGGVSDESWKALAETLSERQLIEVPMLVGHYRMLAGVMASIGIHLEPGFPALPD